jgi:hypothetical protein
LCVVVLSQAAMFSFDSAFCLACSKQIEKSKVCYGGNVPFVPGLVLGLV